MTIESAVKDIKKLQRTMNAHQHAQGIIYLDSVTNAPKGTSQARGETLGVLTQEDYALFINDSVKENLLFLRENADQLDAQTAREVELLWEDFQQTTCVPEDEYVQYAQLVNEAEAVWHEAKEKDDFEMFRPLLEKIVETNKRFAQYRKSGADAYDILLNDYERGFNKERLDVYFAQLKKDLVPLIHAVAEKETPKDITGFFPIEKQRVLSDKLMVVMGIDRSHCGIGETEHPFTINFSKYDVRITTHYHEESLISSMYSVIHEGGHAIYELGTADELQFGRLATGVSMGVHESQSRFYENIIGRSREFIHAVWPTIYDLFKAELSGCTEEEFFRAVNRAQPSLIRTEADELTYSMHVMVRYELEKALFDGSLKVKDLPGEWNRMYKEYLGVDVPDDRQGVLQDSHWSGGMLGYFPSYSLGSAYGAQMLCAMEKEIDVWKNVSAGNLAPITKWLGEKVHSFGSMKDPADIILGACGAPFDAAFYTDYLTRKYSGIYGL